MDEVIARLKAADSLDCKEMYQEGRNYGDTWARGPARPRNLRNLKKTIDRAGGRDVGDLLAAMTCGQGTSVAVNLWQSMHPGAVLDSGEVSMFWEAAIGEGGEQQIEDVDFARGFIEGALELWEKVADQV